MLRVLNMTEDIQDLIGKINREYSEKKLVDTANEKIKEIDKWKEENDYDDSYDWARHICFGIKEDLENKPREFWK